LWRGQIENEYGNIDSAYGAAGKAYMRWAAGMAVSLDTGVPWVMCQQADAPDPLVRDPDHHPFDASALYNFQRNGAE
jgi:hypothetical protein